MVTATFVEIQIAYPSLAFTFNFEDDGGKLPQPQRQTLHIPISSEDGQSLDKAALIEKVKGYIVEYETMLEKAQVLEAELNKEFNSGGEVIK